MKITAPICDVKPKIVGLGLGVLAYPLLNVALVLYLLAPLTSLTSGLDSREEKSRYFIVAKCRLLLYQSPDRAGYSTAIARRACTVQRARIIDVAAYTLTTELLISARRYRTNRTSSAILMLTRACWLYVHGMHYCFELRADKRVIRDCEAS